ncbi:hypothetical protein L3X38_010834 [Prunus dulcis]|uniref:Uncharacterized protein n=1 Tax=Prunus dulcis TaxID=3755 RepID=A0AAD4WH12_PRUDU|nr:hypothetical protein L3X38_010834 [Prunus dulcis]
MGLGCRKKRSEQNSPSAGFDTKRLEECFSQNPMKLLRKHSQASFANSPNKLNQFYKRAWLGEHVAWELGFHRSPPFIATKGSNSVILPSLFPLFSPTLSSLMNSVRPRHMGKEPICGSKVSVLLASSQRGEEPPAFLSTFPMQAARTMEGKGAVLYSTGKPLTHVDFLWFFERVAVDSPGSGQTCLARYFTGSLGWAFLS